MKKGRLITCIVKTLIMSSLLFFIWSPEPAKADIIADGQIHNLHTGYGTDVLVKDSPQGMPTIVNLIAISGTYPDVNPGIAGRVWVYGHSQFSMSSLDHSSFGPWVEWSLNAYDYSKVSISYGEIAAGADDIAVYATDNAFAEISGGLLTGYIIGKENSNIVISGGEINGGIIDGLILADNESEITINGGDFSGILRSWNSGKIIIEGSNFNYPIGAITDLSGTITGTLLSGETINWPFLRGWSSIPPGEILLIPEPATLLLLGLGALFLKKTLTFYLSPFVYSHPPVIFRYH